jgi:hypothetical protein
MSTPDSSSTGVPVAPINLAGPDGRPANIGAFDAATMTRLANSGITPGGGTVDPFVAAGFNDYLSSTTVLRANVQNARAALPNAILLQLNSYSTSGRVIASGSAVSTAIKGGFTDAALPHSYFIDNLAENWIYGTGKQGATTGDGNADFYTYTDGLHPPQVGHDYIASRMFGSFLPILKSVYGNA